MISRRLRGGYAARVGERCPQTREVGYPIRTGRDKLTFATKNVAVFGDNPARQLGSTLVKLSEEE